MREVSINKNATPREIATVMCDVMPDWGWLSSYTYKRKEPKQFSSSKPPVELMNNIDFTKYVYYVANLYTYGGRDFPLTQREFSRYYYDEEMICAYCSVLFYLLVKKEDKLGIYDMKYIQGFYRHPLRDDIPEMFLPIFGSKTQIGIHAFVTVGGAIFDFTIAQQENAFAFDKPYVIGEIPKGMEYFGYTESITVVHEYWKKFAKAEGMTPEQWFIEHKINALTLLQGEYERLRGGCNE
ncbi:hypothetical protein [Bacillus paranthracis]|uniref:hypothetical protein n=1 Tax=Bacillus paranthracis TaxID=2026186 RepID=UPI0029C33816|nr:hypothetical protein [Bacillus paranthracis]MDX6046742.1 hypothetical protein [Bacillus paranthracis]